MKRTYPLVMDVLALSAACGAPAPAAPESPSAPANLVPASGPGSRIVFSGISAHGAAVTSYQESGYTVTASGGAWVGSTSYGAPAPFIQFSTAKGMTTEGRLDIVAGGATFRFASLDLYASIIPIPYTVTGMRGSTVVFTTSGTVPNTFGHFKTVQSPDPSALIDLLHIRLTNAGPACCSNPMGVDNIMFGQ